MCKNINIKDDLKNQIRNITKYNSFDFNYLSELYKLLIYNGYLDQDYKEIKVKLKFFTGKLTDLGK